jgi:cellulose biosynthesis protein BcsQ
VRILAFSSGKGGVGTTSLVYHLAWMLSDLGHRVLAADLDPQGDLSTMFLDESELAELLEAEDAARTVYQAMAPLATAGDIDRAAATKLGDRLALLPGDIRLSAFEALLSQSWTACLGRDVRPFHALGAFYQVLRRAATEMGADVVLVDVGPGAGAIQRAALLAADHVIFPVSAGVASLYGLRSLGPALATWRAEWAQRRQHFQDEHAGATLDLPAGAMQPAGYVITRPFQHAGRGGRASEKGVELVPAVYLRDVLGDATAEIPALDADRHCLGRLKHYPSLMSMARDARKPISHLTPADGAIGAHVYAARDGTRELRALAEAIVERCQIPRSDAS